MTIQTKIPYDTATTFGFIAFHSINILICDIDIGTLLVRLYPCYCVKMIYMLSCTSCTYHQTFSLPG